ncbi:RraA family protein [Paenibacillus abyssi]|uniref:Putative 4-hydroxy-4-methyl-2-oxoglutarate aldolase n=1 Tax=Paenibacillus abyssi TaxID=1340531 RepID=A0A917CJ93_9BACL|nr:RraA family protein [Paenibacillus abyssi]GGF90683.1 methyltransferase [Paenibacillus abyssi]
MGSNLGFRILPLERRAEQSLVDRFARIASPLISDNMNRLQGSAAGLVPIHRSGKLTGTAFTVKTRAGDNLMVHKAIDIAAPGDVIVVDAGGDTTQAILGEIMLRLARKKGIAGYVVDGAIRDSQAFRETDYPCFARGITHRGPYKDGPGEIGVAVNVGGMIVHPGDIIVGDEDGLVAIPLDHANEVIALAEEQQRREKGIMDSIDDGTVDRSWINAALRQKGCVLP